MYLWDNMRRIVLTKLEIFEVLKPKMVFGKDVKEVLTWVETGNADAGIVYMTDAKVSKKVKIAAEAPENSYTPVVYPAAVLKESKKPDAARAFMKYLCGDKARSVFEKYGFSFIFR